LPITLMSYHPPADKTIPNRRRAEAAEGENERLREAMRMLRNTLEDQVLQEPTEGPSWGHSRVVLGAIGSI